MSVNYTSAVGAVPDPRTMELLDWVEELVEYRLADSPLSRGVTYYIKQDDAGDSTGGSGDGSEITPWLVSNWDDAATLINTQMSTNTRFRLNRGDLFRGSTEATVDFANVTIDAYGSGSKPYITHFTETVASGGASWTLDSGTRYYLTGISTKTVGIRRQDDRLYFNNGPMCWVTSLVDVGTVIPNVYGTWFWDTSTNRLYIDIGEDPNFYAWEYAFFDNANDAAILLGKVNGLRVDNVVADGWGLETSTVNGAAGTQRHSLKSTANNTQSHVFTNCESYFGSSHSFAFNGTGGGISGGIVLFKDCKSGWCSFNGTAGETIFNSFIDGGGQEVIFDGCEVTAGTLPITTTPETNRSNVGFFNHTGGSESGLIIHRDVSNNTTDIHYNWTVSKDSTIGNPALSAGDLSAVRSFIIGTRGKYRQPNVINSSVVKINCHLDIDRVDISTEAVQNAPGDTLNGWSWNNIYDIDISNATANTIESLYNPNINTSAKFWNNRFNVYGAGGSVNWRMCFDATTLGHGNDWKNNIFTAENFSGTRTAILNEGNNLVNPGNIDSNAYFGWPGGEDLTTDDGYGNDANKVELSSSLILLYEPSYGDDIYNQGTSDVYLEYDHYGNRRDINFVDIGPIGLFLEATGSIYYGGYTVAVSGDTFSKISKTANEIYETLYLGSLPISILVENGVSKIITITQNQADELSENFIGGAPLLSGRIGNNWYTIARPSVIADADVEYFYKGNLLKAKRYGIYTYM